METNENKQEQKIKVKINNEMELTIKLPLETDLQTMMGILGNLKFLSNNIVKYENKQEKMFGSELPTKSNLGKKYQTHSRDFKEKLIKEYEESNVSMSEVSQKYNVHVSTLARWLLEKKKGKPIKHYTKKKLTAIQEQAVKEYLSRDLTGINYKEIVAKYQIHPSTLFNWVKSYKGINGNSESQEKEQDENTNSEVKQDETKPTND